MLSKTVIRPASAGILRRLASHMRWFPSMVAMSVLSPILAAIAGVGPTVKDVVEFTRIAQPMDHDEAALQNQISPNREQAFIVTRKADVATDVNRFEMLWLDLNPKRLAAAAKSSTVPAPPVSLLTIDSRQDNDDSNPSLRDARWIDDRTIVFRARMHDQPFQVYRLDVLTRTVTQLTFAPLGLLAFDVSGDLKRVVYVALVPNPSVPPGARSIVVGTNSFWSVHFGQGSFRNQQRRYQYFVAEAESRTAARPLGGSFAESSLGFPSPSISPDGRWAALPKYESDRVQEWAKTYPQVADALERFGASRSLDPLSYYSRPTHYVPRRIVLYRLPDGEEQTAIDAPDDSMQKTQHRVDRLWQDGGKSVVIAGTYLPRQSDGKTFDAVSHVIEYWPDTGRWKDIATLHDRLKFVNAVVGQRHGFIAMDGDHERRFERGASGAWQELGSDVRQHAHDAPGMKSGSRLIPASAAESSTVEWRLHVREALNMPPDIVAQGPGGTTVRLTELNPQFAPASWGTMREYSWKDTKGRTWKGGLMVPSDFDPRVRHALVIQTYGFSPSRFYRDGSNTYDGYTSGFPGRALLRENVLVLAVPPYVDEGRPLDQHEKVFQVQDGVRAGIDALVAAGWVDRDRVGIMGWSATGGQVLNLLTFTDIPFRAATMLDGDANTLFSMTITYAVRDGTQVLKEQENGGGPYGDSRQQWIDRDPSLHTDCIRAALRIETYGPEVHNNWDEYALLRRQYKPVEMVVVPGGAHMLARPGERMVSLQGNVDWYAFWLNGQKRSEVAIPDETIASLKDQYARWEQMAVLKQAADNKPQCSGAAGSP